MNALAPDERLQTTSLRTWHIALLTALVGCTAFYIPLLGALQAGNAQWPGFMLTYDQRVAYFPAFVEGCRRFWQGSMLGIDFLTDDGASVFAYRPNFSPFYPPYLLSYLFLNCANLRSGMLAYVTISVAHQFVGMYFTVVFVRRYLGLPGATAILAAALFGLSWYASTYIGETTFYYQMMLLPVSACALCWLAQTRSLLAAIWMAPLFVTFALSNYGPMMIVSIGLSILAGLIASFTWQKSFLKAPRTMVKPFASLLLAAISCFPYFLAQVQFKALMSPTADAINSVAHDLAFTGFDLINGFSQFLNLQRTQFEAILVWGVLPIFLLIWGIDTLIAKKEKIQPRYIWVCGLSAVAYILVLLPTFGTSLMPAADALYYSVPIIGKMHIFQRYLVFAQFFFAIGIATLATIIVVHASKKAKRVMVLFGLAIWLVGTVVVISLPLKPPSNINSLLVELFLLAVGGATIAIAPLRPALVSIAALCSLNGLYIAYAIPNATNNIAQWTSEPNPLGSEIDQIVTFVKTNEGDKALPKILLASPNIETYFNRNLTWLLGSKLKLMNFQGYPPHLAALADYAPSWGTYGQFDITWLKETGADFVFWNASNTTGLTALAAAGFTVEKSLNLPAGNVLGKLSKRPNDDANAPAPSYDNGIVRILGPQGSVQNFATDYSRRVTLEIAAPTASKLTYLLWPNPYMVPYVDGKRVGWTRDVARTVSIAIEPGSHTVQIRFVNTTGLAFHIVQIVLWLFVGLALALEFWPTKYLPPSLAHRRSTYLRSTRRWLLRQRFKNPLWLSSQQKDITHP